MFIFKYCSIATKMQYFMYIINMTNNVIMFPCNLVGASFHKMTPSLLRNFYTAGHEVRIRMKR